METIGDGGIDGIEKLLTREGESISLFIRLGLMFVSINESNSVRKSRHTVFSRSYRTACADTPCIPWFLPKKPSGNVRMSTALSVVVFDRPSQVAVQAVPARVPYFPLIETMDDVTAFVDIYDIEDGHSAYIVEQ